MNENLSRIVAPATILMACAVALYLAVFRPGSLSSVYSLGGLIFLQVLLATLWNYRTRFFPLLLLVFLWAGMSLPLQRAWTSGRWFVLAAGALFGFILFLRRRQHHFGLFHLVALVCVSSAVISGVVSGYPSMSILKALSLLLLFAYCSSGARLAMVGEEGRFFSGLLLGCEVLIYCSALAYFVLRVPIFGNPNSLGGVMGVVIVPLMLWGILASERQATRRRRLVGLGVALVLLFFSLARAGIVAGAVSCILLLLASRRYRLLIQGAALVAVLATAVVAVAPPRGSQSDSVTATLLYKGQRSLGVFASRQSPWSQTISVIRQNPWFGSGFGTSPTSSEEAVQVGQYASSSRLAREHGNSYLAILEWVGLLGVAPFVLLVLLTTTKIGQVMLWLRRTGNVYHPAIPLTAVLTAGLVHATFEDWLFAVGYYLCVFFWSCAFALVDLAPPRTRVVAPSVSPLTSRNWTGNFGATPSPR